MEKRWTEIMVKGRQIKVPFAEIEDRGVIVTGKWVRIATIEDEEFVEGASVVNPECFIGKLKEKRLGADIFTFAEPLENTNPRHDFYFEWDNAAVIRITDYKSWEGSLSQDTRRNVRKAAKAGVILKAVAFDDNLVRGIVDIYNETPVRQGRRFWHYGKGFDVIKAEAGTHLDRSEFIGAFLGEELIGFIKMIYVNRGGHIVHILSKAAHADKRPTNALIAKAVEICAQRGLSHFVYCKYVYGKNEESPLTEFKRRNGFEQVLFPRYYVPVSAKGRFVLPLKLHHGVTNWLPKRCLAMLLGARRRWSELFTQRSLSQAKP